MKFNYSEGPLKAYGRTILDKIVQAQTEADVHMLKVESVELSVLEFKAIGAFMGELLTYTTHRAGTFIYGVKIICKP